jgi:hypothetical protein
MNERYSLGQLGNLKITADRSAARGFILLWAILSIVGLVLFRLKPRAALAGGLLGATLHLASELWHQMGHARAAERTGHPMRGVHLWGLLGASIYPADEPQLPDEVHVARAVGGPQASAVLAVAGGLLALVTRPWGGAAHMAATILALDNLLVFTLGAFLPMPFMETDGEVIWRYVYGHRKHRVLVQE